MSMGGFPVGMFVGGYPVDMSVEGCPVGMCVEGCPVGIYYIEPSSSMSPLKCSSLSDLFNCNLNIICSRNLKLNDPLIPNQFTLNHTGCDS